MIQDYTPFMDLYPESKLCPVTEFPAHLKIQKYDYVQSLLPTPLNDTPHKHGMFFLIVKDRKFGIYMFEGGFFSNTCSIALKPEYESIEFISYKGRSFGAVVKKDGKYGIYFWTYGTLSNDTFIVPTIYDSFEKIDNTRFKGIKDGQVTYYDSTGHVLK